MWDHFDVVVKDINRDDFVKVNARVEIYRNKPQLSLQQLRLAKPEEVDLADFLAHTKEDVGKLYSQLLEYAGSIANPWLKKLTTSIISHPALPPNHNHPPPPNALHPPYLSAFPEP